MISAQVFSHEGPVGHSQGEVQASVKCKDLVLGRNVQTGGRDVGAAWRGTLSLQGQGHIGVCFAITV